MRSKLNIIFVLLAIVLVAVVFNFDRLKQLGSAQDVAAQAAKFEDKKSEIQKFFNEQKWFDYNSAEGLVDLEKMGATKIVYLHFWASWCAPCLNEIPELISFAKKHSDTAQFVLVSLDENQVELDKFLKSFPELKSSEFVRIWDYDKKISRKLNVDRLPMTSVLKPTEDSVQHIKSVVNWKSLE